MKRIVVALIFTISAVLPVKAQKADSLRCRDESIRAVQFIAPAILIGSGTAVTFTSWGEKNINLPVHEFVINKNFPSTWVDDVTTFLPAAAHLGLGWVGVPSLHTGKERIATFTTAGIIQMGVVRSLKHALDVVRPDGTNDHSFPSNHTSSAFMGAELVRIEYGPWWGLGAYTVATGTALMRIYNNRHWVGDVLAGAGIGILSAQAAYWLLPLERKLFGWDTVCAPASEMVLVPYAAPGAAGMSFSLTF